MNEGLLEGLSSIFSEIWTGMSNTLVPGTSWSMAGFFLAIFTAGVIGKILKAFFSVFGSHFDSGRSGGKPTAHGKYNKKWSDLKDD